MPLGPGPAKCDALLEQSIYIIMISIQRHQREREREIMRMGVGLDRVALLEG